MEPGCDLEVDVNGEEVFLVNKRILSSFSNRLSKLINKPSVTATTTTLKVIFHDFPGGAEAFELVARFCYNYGKTQITPTNTCLLHYAAHFMEMGEDDSSGPNLIKQTEKAVEGIPYWSWSEILNALKQCQDFFPLAISTGILEKVLDSLVGRIVSSINTSPSNSSPESSGFRFSCDTRSTISTKNSYHRAWWFEDLTILTSDVLEKTVKMMISRKMDHNTISRFLFYYLKTRFSNATSIEKSKVMEVVVDLLHSLDRSSVSCKALFGILRLSSCLNLTKCCRSRLESMIGFQLDQATLDNLLVPSPPGVSNLYDVNLVLRFLKSFLVNGRQTSITQLKRVGMLMDLYLAEVAPDSYLKPQKFVSLAMALPDSARDSFDGVYRAIDMYLEAHAALSEEEKMKVCCAVNYAKISTESCKHLARNSKFPSRTAIQALISQQSKLRSLLQDMNNNKTPLSSPMLEKEVKEGEQIILYAKKLGLPTENEKLKAHLQGMQWRVMELEKLCRKMQTQMAKIMKTRISTPSGPRSLPRLCS
uniref:BTB/POZ domain-containing protein At3g22104 n=1 Tax=Anthurium amnicola TaxID=1678845 RepID=A0A1D1XKG7_9ARAE